MGSGLKLFLPLILFAIMAVFLFRGLSLDPQAMPSALIDQPLPEFTLPVLGEDRLLKRDELVGEGRPAERVGLPGAAPAASSTYLLQIAASGVPVYGINYKDDDAAAGRWLAELAILSRQYRRPGGQSGAGHWCLRRAGDLPVDARGVFATATWGGG